MTLPWRASLTATNTLTLQPAKLDGFQAGPKRHLGELFSPSQNAYYVLLGRRGAPYAPRERMLFAYYLDNVLDACQQRITGAGKSIES